MCACKNPNFTDTFSGVGWGFYPPPMDMRKIQAIAEYFQSVQQFQDDQNSEHIQWVSLHYCLLGSCHWYAPESINWTISRCPYRAA
jgi:hypothetical protein